MERLCSTRLGTRSAASLVLITHKDLRANMSLTHTHKIGMTPNRHGVYLYGYKYTGWLRMAPQTGADAVELLGWLAETPSALPALRVLCLQPMAGVEAAIELDEAQLNVLLKRLFEARPRLQVTLFQLGVRLRCGPGSTIFSAGAAGLSQLLRGLLSGSGGAGLVLRECKVRLTSTRAVPGCFWQTLPGCHEWVGQAVTRSGAEGEEPTHGKVIAYMAASGGDVELWRVRIEAAWATAGIGFWTQEIDHDQQEMNQIYQMSFDAAPGGFRDACRGCQDAALFRDGCGCDVHHPLRTVPFLQYPGAHMSSLAGAIKAHSTIAEASPHCAWRAAATRLRTAGGEPDAFYEPDAWCNRHGKARWCLPWWAVGTPTCMSKPVGGANRVRLLNGDDWRHFVYSRRF
jgi:hypothetical protein